MSQPIAVLDATDRRILVALQSQPDLTVADLATLVGLSHTPCWRRVKRLESAGIIVGRATILNRHALGLSVCVFAYIRLRQHDEETLDALEQQALRHAEIVECFSMSGESDFVMRIIARSIEDYQRFLKTVLLHLPGLASINSSFALKEVKLTTTLPLEGV